MSDIERTTIIASLKSKGFKYRKQSKKSGHDKYCYFYDNRWHTHIQARISRGSHYKTYPQALWKRMKIRLYLDKLEDVQFLLECPMDAEEYASILREKRQI